MCYILKQKSLVNKLYKYIWTEKHTRSFSKVGGVSQEDFLDWLFQKEFAEPYYSTIKRFWLKKVVQRVDKKWKDDFYSRREELLKDCIKDGYIDKDFNNLVVSPQGKRLLSPVYNVWVILKHPFVLKIIEFGIPSYFGYKLFQPLIQSFIDKL